MSNGMPKWAVASLIGCVVLLAGIGGCTACSVIMIGTQAVRNGPSEDTGGQADGPMTSDRAEAAAAADSIAEGEVAVTAVAGHVIEETDAWTRYGWQLTVRNASDAEAFFEAVITFTDVDGVVVHTERVFPLSVSAQHQEILDGEVQLDAATAVRVDEIEAEVRPL